MQEIPVYIFLGFLESGKTKFIQETLQDERMNSGENTLLLVCEEGVEEYEPEKFAIKNTVKVSIENSSELNQENLTNLAKKHKIERVFVEYNGTWLLEQFFDGMPENWVVNQIMTFFDTATFLNYNKNMRQLVFDKISMTQLVVFNRFSDKYDKNEYHKIVRSISRRPDIVYDYPDRPPQFDDIVDPLPYDINAPIIKIEDRDFAWFYRDLSENTQNYIGKTVSFKGLAAVSARAGLDIILLGRHIMTCCEADIKYSGLAVKHGNILNGIKTRDWLQITAKITIGECPAYRSEGPILIATSLKKTTPPEERVATFY